MAKFQINIAAHVRTIIPHKFFRKKKWKGGKNRNEMERREKKGWGGCGKTFLSSSPSPLSPQSITSLFYHCQNCRVEKITGLPEIVHKKEKNKKRSFYNYPSFEPVDTVKMAILYAFWQLCLPIIIRCRALAPLSRTSTLFFPDLMDVANINYSFSFSLLLETALHKGRNGFPPFLPHGKRI